MKKIDEFCERSADRLVWLFISAYVIIFSYLSFLKFQSFGYLDWDLASDAVVVWNSVHGKLLYYPFLEQSIFGAHLYLVIFLILPVYALFQSPLTLLFLQSVFLGLAAFPLYLLARTRLNKTFALSLAAAYLLYPSLGYINLFETHFEVYEIFFLFFALYYFEKENFKKFLVFISLALLCKENASLAVFMLGIYALIRKRPGKWVVIPLLAGAIWFLAAVKAVIPHFAKDAKLYHEGFIFSAYYSHLGNSLAEMARTIIFHPLRVAAYALTPNKLLYLFRIFLPVGFLSLLSPWALVPTIPILMQNLLSMAETHASIYFQYVALLIPFVFYSAVQAIARLLRNKFIMARQVGLLGYLLVFTVFSGFYMQAPQFNIDRQILQYSPNDYSEEKEKLVKAIPKGSPVIATFQFLPKLADRRGLYSMHLVSSGYKMYTAVKYEPPKDLEYALIDFNEPLMIAGFFPPSAPANIRSFIEAGGWSALRALDDIVLFKKGRSPGSGLCEAVDAPKIGHPMGVNLRNEIIFLGYDIIDDGMPEGRILHLAYYWKKIGGKDRPSNFFIQFTDMAGNIRFQAQHTFGYRVYLRDEWKEGQVMKENHYILVPSGLEKGDYNISFGPFIFEKGTDSPEEARAR